MFGTRRRPGRHRRGRRGHLGDTSLDASQQLRHALVARVVALSGGYSREEANDRLSRQNGMVASFSRALSEGLSAQQSDEEFDATLDASIGSIAAASAT